MNTNGDYGVGIDLVEISINKTKELALLDPFAFKKTKQDFRQEDISRILSGLDSS